MRKKIKCGVIGAGSWATFAHIPALLGHPDADLVAIENDNPQDAQKIVDDFQIPIACTTASELLAIEDLSAIVVSSSPNLHYAQARAGLRAGKHVLIEKPMTLTASQARDLLETAEERNLQLLVSYPWHYTPHATAAQGMIREGKLGRVRMISALLTNPVSHLIRGEDTTPTYTQEAPYLRPRLTTYSDPAIAGGGHIYAQVSHIAAYLTFLTGRSPSEVFARFHNDGARLDIYDTLDLRMEDGTIVAIASTGATSTSLRTYEVRIFGTEGILYLDLWRGTMEHIRMDGERHAYADLAPGDIYPHEAPAKNLIDSILDPSSNRSPASLGVSAMEVIEAACLSAKSGQNVLVPKLVMQDA